MSLSAQHVPDSLTTSANVIIIDEVMDVEHSKFNELSYHKKVKLKILNKRGDDFQSVYFNYKDGTEKISGIKIRVYNDAGTVLHAPKLKEIKDYASGDGFSIISDYRVKYWTFETKKYPVYIEYEYVKVSKNTLTLPFWSPIPTNNVAVLNSSYNLKTNLQIQEKKLNFSAFKSIKKEGQNYRMRNQKALTREKYSPLYVDLLPILIIRPQKFNYEGFEGSADDWNSFALWVYDSFLKDKSFAKEKELKAQLDKIISKEDDAYNIARKIYDYVQENTRYISIGLDDGGLNPLNPQKVEEVKYGDCKALSLYMKKLLELYGIKSNYVIVHAGRDEMIDLFSDFPNTYPGNHAILNIPLEDETLWVDCTSNDNPFNFLGSFTDDRSVLEINEQGGNLNRTPIYDETRNRTIDTTYLVVAADGNLLLKKFQHNEGLSMESDIYLRKMSFEKQKKHFKEQVFDNFEVKEINSLSFDLDETNVKSKQSCEMAINNFVEYAGDYIFLKTNIAESDIPELPKDKKRKNEIYFPRGYYESHTLVIDNLSDYDIIEKQEFINETEYGSYSSSIRKENDQFFIDRSFTLKKGRYPASEYLKLKSFFDSCLKIERSPLSLKKI